MSHADAFLQQVARIAGQLDRAAIESVARLLVETRQAGGRLFVLGVGGSAANAAHAVNDFRKLAGLEAYAPTDNVAEVTARTNDEGWDTVFAAWLQGSRLRAGDLVMVLSVGGGSVEPPVSASLVGAVDYARQVGARVCGIVGRDGGHTAAVADACVGRAHGGSGCGHAPHGGLPGRGLAPARLAPGGADGRHALVGAACYRCGGR